MSTEARPGRAGRLWRWLRGRAEPLALPEPAEAPEPAVLRVAEELHLIRLAERVAIGKERNVTLVPDTAILSDQDKKYVLALDEKNVVQRVDVGTARLLDNGLRVVIPPPAPARGLTGEDWIVVQGLQSARVNYPVDPVKPAGATPTTQPGQPAGQPSASVNEGK